MSTPTFTPGPWRRVGHRQIAATHGAGPLICEVWPGSMGNDNAAGNEALIAAAPDLVAVLLAIVAALETGTAILPHRVVARMVAVLASVGRAAS